MYLYYGITVLQLKKLSFILGERNEKN
jgi:hypothetical protein